MPLVLEALIIGDSNCLTRFVELFTILRVRRVSLALPAVMVAQQMGGINYHCSLQLHYLRIFGI
jgi:hypothetical protein